MSNDRRDADEETKQTCIYLPESLHRRLRVASAKLDQSITGFIRDAIQKHLSDLETETETGE